VVVLTMGEVGLTDDSVYKLSDIRARASLVTASCPPGGEFPGKLPCYQLFTLGFTVHVYYMYNMHDRVDS